MKKLLRYIIGSAADAPSAPPKKKTVPAHELALKQTMARRRDEAAKDGSAGEAPPAASARPVVAKVMPERPAVAEESAQKDKRKKGKRKKDERKKGETRAGRGRVSLPPSPAKAPKDRRARHGHGLADIAVVVAGRAKRKKSQQPAKAAVTTPSRKKRRSRKG
jgi:hypothetical protein